jgi:formylglycine-generating enzyme required for sulfatase activity
MNGAAAIRLAQGGMLALILFGVFAVRSESARAMDNDCDGVEVFRSNTSAEPHCIHPGTGAKEWFKDCSECPEMVLVPAGRFMMGSEKDNNEKPVHRVTIAKPFAVGKYSVTRAEFAAFINSSGYKIQGDCLAMSLLSGDQIRVQGNNSWRSPGFEQSDRDPVVCVDWFDAQEYANWLAIKTGKEYRFLTEAEYEYAARAGTTTSYFWGEEIGNNRANCNGCGSQWDGKRTAPVGSFANNGFGLHEVHGNVSSWVEDCYRENYSLPPLRGNDVCLKRVLRGGTWRSNPKYIRAASRLGWRAYDKHNYFGIRVARTIAP